MPILYNCHPVLYIDISVQTEVYSTMRRVLLTAVLVIGGLLSPLSHAYSGGTGTAADPYQIANKADLLSLAAATSDYDKCFILMADIDLEGQIFNTAIIAPDIDSATSGFQGTRFRGFLDGNDHTIKHFNIDGGSNDYLGVIGCVDIFLITTISNLGIENYTITSSLDSGYVGGLVGDNSCFISNCFSNGNIHSEGDYIGGLVGANTQGSIISCYNIGVVQGGLYTGGLAGINFSGVGNCYNTGIVSGSDYVGGLIGYDTVNNNSLIIFSGSSVVSCYNTGTVSGLHQVGGLIGCTNSGIPDPFGISPETIVTNGYNTGSVEGSEQVGGLIGYNNCNVSYCYNSGIVTGAIETGGLLGHDSSNFPVVGSFWDTETSGQSTSAGGEGNTTAQMHTLSTFTNAGWDFSGIDGDMPDWAMAGNEYPRLIWEIPIIVPEIVGETKSDAQTTLMNLGLRVEFTEIYSDTVPVDVVISQSPDAGTEVAFNYVVSIEVSLGPSAIVPDVTGMIQISAESEISNATLIIGEITYDYSSTIAPGSIISQNPAPGTIVTQNSAVDIVVSLGHPYAGGAGTHDDPFRIASAEQLNRIGLRYEDLNKSFVLTGNIDMSGITEDQYNIIGKWDYFTGTFDGKGYIISNFTYNTQMDSYVYAVGLFGSASNATIKNIGLENVIIHVATKSSYCNVGGLMGYQSEGTMINCYSLNSEITLNLLPKTVASTYGCAGGLAGTSSGVIYNCYATGMVHASSCPGALSDAGGLVGCFGSGRIENSYSMGSVYAYSSSFQSNCGGLAGMVRSGIVRNCYSTNSVYVSNLDWLAMGGGLAGYVYYSSCIEKCYSTGSVTCNDQNRIIGGLIGLAFSSTVKNCFWDIQSSGMARGAQDNGMDPNEVKGKTTAEMKSLSTFISAGWDFANEITNGMEDVWRMCEDGTNYPKLNWESTRGDFACPNGVREEDLSVLFPCWLQVVQVPSDLNGDNIVDFTDFNTLSQRWLISGFALSGIADITGDGNVDQADLEILISHWLFEENTACRMADLDADGRIDLADYAVFAQHWLEGI